MVRQFGMGLLAATLILSSCTSEAPDDARLAPDVPAEPSDSDREATESSWRIPFADDDGAIQTTVPPRQIGTVEIETNGPVEVILAVTTEDIDYGSIRGVDISWDQSGAVTFPVVAEDIQDCQAVPALDADEWTSGPLLFAGLDAPSADRYRLHIQHRCDRELTFTVMPVEATRTPQAAVGDWSNGWLPNDAGWVDAPWAPSFLSVDDDGRMAHCLVYSEDSTEASALQWEPRGEGSIGIRLPSGQTSEPRMWLVGDRLVLIDSSVGAMIDWLGDLAAAPSPGSASGWTADWGDIFVRRSASEQPEGC